MNIYLLYQGDAWLSTSSLELIGVFSSLEKASNHLHKKKRGTRSYARAIESIQ